MKKIILICMIMLLFPLPEAFASYMYAEASLLSNPDVPVDTVFIGIPFTIDITIENDFGMMLGGSMPLMFYSDDGIIRFSHFSINGTSPTGFSDKSILTLNGWDATFPLINQWTGFSWDGSLADTVNWTGLTLMGWMPEGIPTKYIKFGFRIDSISQVGHFCVDSVSIPNQIPPGKFDWVFDDPNFTFSGPYCWTIVDPDDWDVDGVLNGFDNCPEVYNPDQADGDGNGVGDVCEAMDINDLNGYVNIPERFTLRQNYPNPFNPSTTIEYTIPYKSFVTVEIYNILGKKVKTLVNKAQPAGEYQVHWDGTDKTSVEVATGVYLFRIRAGDFTESKKMMLLK